jgi:RNA polymerase sigma-54 factor
VAPQDVSDTPADDLLKAAPADEKPEIEKLGGALDKGDLELAEFLQDDGYLPPTEAPRKASESDPLEAVSDETVCAADVLLPMIRARIEAEDYPVAEAIVDNLDEDGFLLVSREELATQLSLPQERVDRVLYVVQHLEGGGIGARNVRDALILQLEVMGYTPESVEYRILVECYEAMAKKQFVQIARLLDTSEERVREAIEGISQLEPRPCRRFGARDPGYVRPDFCIEWSGDQLNFYPTDGSTPRLRLSARYREILRSPKTYPREQVEFARKKFQGALMLIKGIESRKRTLNRVMERLLEQQHDFLVLGREHLKPISIKETGNALGIHPSTISRAVQGKYVETPYAILPMRFFFSTGTAGTARHSVKDRIKRILESEDGQTPYSDEEIGRLLEKDGIKISRRTVAKYRAEMNIPGCNERRQG